MKTLKASQIKPGHFIVNLGIVDSVGLFEGNSLVRILITTGLSMSSAYYWFHSDELLIIDYSRSKKETFQSTAL